MKILDFTNVVKERLEVAIDADGVWVRSTFREEAHLYHFSWKHALQMIGEVVGCR
jgi:hypothetical protein